MRTSDKILQLYRLQANERIIDRNRESEGRIAVYWMGAAFDINSVVLEFIRRQMRRWNNEMEHKRVHTILIAEGNNPESRITVSE